MGYWVLRDTYGEWAVDWDIVYRIIRGFHTADRRLAYHTVVSTDVWGTGPTLRHVDVDWDAVRRDAIGLADRDFAVLAERSTHNMRDVQYYLRWMVKETQRLTSDFSDKMRALQAENAGRINAVSDNWEGAAEVAKIIRDASAEFVVIGASVLSGGTAIAALGGGSVMKGAFKYQDTENIAGSIMTASGTFAFGLVKLGGKGLEGAAKVAQDRAVIILQSVWETGTALADGKSLGDAIESGAAKLASGMAGSLFLKPFLKPLTDRAGPFVQIAFSKPGAELTLKNATKLAESVFVKPIEVAVKSNVRDFVHNPEAFYRDRAKKLDTAWTVATNLDTFLGFGAGEAPSAEKPADPRRNLTLLSSATLQDDLLLSLAIVNMKEGISWPVEQRAGSRR